MTLGDFFAELARTGLRLELDCGRLYLPANAPKALRMALDEHQQALLDAMGIDPFADMQAEREAIEAEGCKRWTEAELDLLGEPGIPF